MNVVVCLKQVPGTTQVKIDPETNTLIREGIENIINPFDTYAIEEGVRLRERFGGKVTAISMGPPQAEIALREAISLGADEGILLSDPAFAGADTWVTSYTLSMAMRKLGQYDLIPVLHHAPDAHPAIGYLLYIADIGDKWERQHLGELRADLPGIAVQCLPTADDKVVSSQFANRR